MKSSNSGMVDLQLVPVLIQVLESLSITDAASKLGVTQSAVSHSLKKLREQLGDELVIREGNGLVLTSKAEALYPPLKRWMGEMDHILDSASFDPKSSTKVFYVASTDIVEQMYMPRIIKHFQKLAPGISIRLLRWAIGNVHLQLMNGEIDLGIGVKTPDSPNIMRKVLYRDRFSSAARIGHPVLKSPDLETFLSYPHTMTSSNRSGGVVDQVLESMNRSRRLTHTVSNFSSAPFIVEHSDCILTAPSRFLRFCAKEHKIRLFEPPVEVPEFSVKLFWAKKDYQDEANAWFRAELAKVVK
jgi:DNA-binding transcriptional LysR family regulator